MDNNKPRNPCESTHTHTHTENFLEDNINTIVLGDSYKLIKKIPNNSIDLIILDPPYEVETKGGNTNIGKNVNIVLSELEELEITDGIDYSLLDELCRVMKKINIYIWCNKKQILDYLKYFIDGRGCRYEILLYLKNDPTPLCGGNYLIDKEYCLYFRKGVKLNTSYDTARTYFLLNKNVKDRAKYLHPTIKPLSIIRTLIKNSSNEGDIVLDCFSGSGTTCVAAKELNRRYLGIEIDPRYHQISIDRLNGILANGQISFDTDINKI